MLTLELRTERILIRSQAGTIISETHGGKAELGNRRQLCEVEVKTRELYVSLRCCTSLSKQSKYMFGRLPFLSMLYNAKGQAFAVTNLHRFFWRGSQVCAIDYEYSCSRLHLRPGVLILPLASRVQNETCDTSMHFRIGIA